MAEQKEQNGANPAQSPDSKVSPEAIEEKMVEDSKKAGVVAYQFDPDASVEQKAEQVQAGIISDSQVERRAQPAALVTDLPVKNGVTNGGPSSQSLKSPVMQPSDDETPKYEKPELTEEERFAPSRTGWAPRFHIPETEEDMEDPDNAMDRQTLLETKLDDKFYGDWYHNTGVIIFACLASWVIALLGGGLGWVFIVMATCGTYYRTSIRRVRRNFRDDINRELAKNKLETDSETLEWINSFLVKFWPIYAPNLADSIVNSVDQVLSTATPAFLDSLRLKTFILGSKPPRLEHVKTYPKTDPDIVLMDWKFSFTPTDTMDLTTRQLKNKINPKVVLEVRVGKGVVSKGLDVIVEDFAFSGLMRVKVKLQIPFPHVERVDVSFLGAPEIDYVCKPLGGDLLGFDINIIPGLESFIKEQIHGNLAPMMYDPNVFPVEIAKLLAGNPVDQAVGVVAVTIHGAHNLKSADKFSGTPDPYVVASINSRVPLGKTKTVHDTSNPRFNETLYIIITSFTDALTLQVYDWNDYRKDAELGVATFPLEILETVDEHENLSLDVKGNGRQRGVIQVDVRFFPVLTGGKTETGVDEPPPELNTGIIRFSIDQAKDLDGTRSFVGQLNPYGVLMLNGKEVHITKKLKRTNNPIFPNPSKEILISDRKSARLGLKLKDDRDLATDPVLGTYQIKLNEMLKMMDKGQEWFNLAGAKTGRVKMRVEWKPVALKGIAAGGGYVTPIGIMRVHIQNARNLKNVETMGKSDPYLRILQSGIPKARTVTWKNNLNPDWDEVHYIPMHSAKQKLTLEVLDEESIGKDRPLGMLELNASDYIRETEDGLYEVDDERQLMSTGLRLDRNGPVKGTLNYTVSFYPTLNVVDPEEEEEEEKNKKAMESRTSLDGSRKSMESTAKTESGSQLNGRPSIDTTTSKPLTNGESEDQLRSPTESEKGPPKIHLTPQDIPNYESGLIVFKLLEGNLAHTDVQLEVLMDDHLFPSYTSPKARTRHTVFGDVGDAFVRELEYSKITLRLVGKTDKKGDEDGDNAIAKLSGSTLTTLQRCLYKPTELTLRSDDGLTSKVTVSLRYIPVKMKLDPSESINNMGTLRVDVLDAADLPSADRNGFSDPYCKFKMDGKEVFKTKVQKKTLHPAWNEFFETPVKSRIGADFKLDVYDWDFGEKADYLGGTPVNLEGLEPFRAQEISLPLDGKSGAVRLKLLFKPDYIIRSRQGSSTFSGTFATPGKIVGAPVKGVGILGGGVVKGASFLKQGFRRIRNGGDDSSDSEEEEEQQPAPSKGHTANTPSLSVTSPDAPQHSDTVSPLPSNQPALERPHTRSRSNASHLGDKFGFGSPSSKAETGQAIISIISATGYPRSANVRIVVKQATSKGMKEIHKTKAIKSQSSGSDDPSDTISQFDQSHETCKAASVAADTQFQLQVKDHATFGSDDILGEKIFFIDDQGSSAGKERGIQVGSGTVTLKTSFIQGDSPSLRPSTSHSTGGGAEDTMPDSPDSRKPRRSFLSKRLPSGSGGS